MSDEFPKRGLLRRVRSGGEGSLAPEAVAEGSDAESVIDERDSSPSELDRHLEGRWRLRIECAAPAVAARFWSRAMKLPVDYADDTIALLRTNGPVLVFSLNTADDKSVSSRLRFDIPTKDLAETRETVLRLGAVRHGSDFLDPARNVFRLVEDPLGGRFPSPAPPDIHRFVALGDSTTEGLVDVDPEGGWRGWADRLAAKIAAASDHRVEYANLAISGSRMADIRTQLEPALAMQPDVMSIAGGVNDLLGLRPNFAQIEQIYDEMFSAAMGQGITVITFTMPDISKANPVATVVRDRLAALNDIIRRQALKHDVACLDFEHVPSASDPRLWGEDRLHINTLGHLRVAAAMAWLLNLPGSDLSWETELDAQPGEQEPGATDEPGSEIGSNLHWARRHFGPWVVQGIRGAHYQHGTEPKRPTPTAIDLTAEAGTAQQSNVTATS